MTINQAEIQFWSPKFDAKFEFRIWNKTLFNKSFWKSLNYYSNDSKSIIKTHVGLQEEKNLPILFFKL